ncbi:discoidin domain-containing protein [Lysobacter sp. TLK-CK17T]|uniref:Discoidin domain-containing protein n=1 Tax=Marilutibacter chinensis TaxID=2912247 RepID=A0ABS9HYU4_9GAMM|nr:discoidin domain-containing protein [Lysobacter chinensis]
MVGSANLALNRPATGSTACNASEGPERAVNGSVSGGNGDKFCTLAASKWLQVDLGSSQAIGRFVIRHAGAGGESTDWNTRAYTIRVSGDGSTWTTVASVNDNTASITSHDIASVTARHVRLDIVTPAQDGNPAARIYEFEVHAAAGDVNLALQQPATGSNACGSAEGPAKAVNGSVSGGNSDKFCTLAATKWLQVDLGASRSIKRFVLRHAGAGGESTGWNTRAYGIGVSGDGATWAPVVEMNDNTASVTSHDILPVSGRYVRLDIVTPTQNGDPAARIYEFEVY